MGMQKMLCCLILPWRCFLNLKTSHILHEIFDISIFDRYKKILFEFDKYKNYYWAIVGVLVPISSFITDINYRNND